MHIIMDEQIMMLIIQTLVYLGNTCMMLIIQALVDLGDTQSTPNIS